MATVSDVAKLAQVSPGVVSRLLNEDSTLRVREETRQRVLDAAKQLNYTPNYAARALRNARVGVIGLAVHDASNPVYTEIIAGAQAEATKAGYALMLADVDALATNDAVFKRVISSGAIDGLLLQRAGNAADALVSRIAAGTIPTVLLNDRASGRIGSVAVDDYSAARMATEHLIELGHQRIGYLQVDGPLNRADARRKGWTDALEAAGLDSSDALVFPGGHTAPDGYRGMKQLLSAAVPPSAVFVANVLSAIGALSAASDEGVLVPEEISLLGLHDVFLADYLQPRLSVVRLPLFEMGARAVTNLLDQLGAGEPRHEVISAPAPQMILRASTAPPSRANPAGAVE